MLRHTIHALCLGVLLLGSTSCWATLSPSATKEQLPFVRVPYAHSIIITVSDISTLQTYTPISISLQEQRGLRLSFDLLETNARLLGYKITHYNADWTPSILTSSEVVEGFSEGELDPPSPSGATLTAYQHYTLELLPERIKFRTSGNYLLTIYDLDATDSPLLALPILVTEHYQDNQVSVSDNSWQGRSQTHQYLSCQIARELIGQNAPHQWLSVYAMQNAQWGGLQKFSTPSSVDATTITYDLAQALAFSGGTEYYRIEHLNDYAPSLGVSRLYKSSDRIELEGNVHPLDSLRSYTYEPDLDGKQLIRSTAPINLETEGDYHWAEFRLRGEPTHEGKVLIEGEAFAHLSENARTLNYDHVNQCYRICLPMKVGYQEYSFVGIRSKAPNSPIIPLLGSHAQTTNTYTVLLYFRSPSDRADRLLDITQIRYTP